MSTTVKTFPTKWPEKFAKILISTISPIIFLFLDFLDFLLCIFFSYMDEFLEGKHSSSCYCQQESENGNEERECEEISGTLFGRKNVFRELGFFKKRRKWENSKKITSGNLRNRWSDCGCESCVSWMNDVNQRLHVVVKEPAQAKYDDCIEKPRENVIFLHGFLSSSSFWTETIFPHLSESMKSSNYRLFAVDLLGFGRSPKPRECLYTLSDHLEMVEKSVISNFQLNSFHFVAHSMGCVIALALAAKYPNSLKSITLIAPPYFPCSNGDDAGSTAFRKLAGKSLWPPLLFGAAVMSWYEHLGRFVCFVVCRNHRTWERILKLLTHRSELHFIVMDMSRHTHHSAWHTHHSAWHTMHNVICGGAKLMDNYLETLSKSRARFSVILGSQDMVVPLECSSNIKIKVPDAEVKIIPNADHISVILGREKEFARNLEHTWASVTKQKGNM